MSEALYFVRGGEVLGGLVALAFLWWGSVLVARRRGGRTSPLTAFVLTAPLAFIVGPTLLRGTVGFHFGSVLDWSGQGWDRLSYDPFTSQTVLNAALFFPAGAIYAFALRSLARVALGLIALSFAVECLQGLTTAGVPDPADLIANSVGGAIGALTGYALAVIFLAATRQEVNLPSALVRLGCALVAGTMVVPLLHVAADRRQEQLVEKLRGLFEHSSLEQYLAWQADDAGGGLDAHVFRPSVLGPAGTDGAVRTSSSVLQRYPASFFGVERCVLVTWQPGHTTIQPESGEVCVRRMID